MFLAGCATAEELPRADVFSTRKPPALTAAPLAAPVVTDEGCVVPSTFFEWNKAVVTQPAADALVACANAVVDHVRGGGSILVTGSTDGTGDHVKVNLPLSVRRADAVAGIFVGAGVDPKAITVVGIGEEGAVDGVADPDRRRVVVAFR